MAIYLDNAATTSMDKSLIEIYQRLSCVEFCNPSAGYSSAIKNSQLLNEARNIILNKLGLSVGDIIFTSGATEANNLAIRGSVREGKSEYIFSSGEHPSVYNVAKSLELSGKIVKYIPLQQNGQIDYDELEKLVTKDTRLVSVMFVNNETGAVNDIQRISRIVKNKNPRVLLHVDMVQGFCKIGINFSAIDVDFLSISGHKFHGPKGVGALYVKNKAALKSIVYGGGQEFGLRSGTENLPAIYAMSKEIEKIDISQNFNNVLKLRKAFLDNINQDIVAVISTYSPYIVSMSFPGVNGETLMRALENEVIVGTGSACSTKKVGNRVLQNMGFSTDYIKSCVRVSFNPYQSEEEVVLAAKIMMKKYLEILEKVK